MTDEDERRAWDYADEAERRKTITKPRSKFPPMPDDGLALPDLQEWIAFYGGYDKIPSWAWAEWDRLHDVYHAMQRLDARSTNR
jgi:hypothetical protein